MNGTIGEIRAFGGNFAPRAWAFCNGQLLSINQNQALFSILGTTYGGDGRTTFGLPDLRGRGPISEGTGPGLSPHKLGSRSGQEIHYLTSNEMPSHFHSSTQTPFQSATTIEVSSEDAGSPDPSDAFLATAGENVYTGAGDGETLGGVSTQVTGGAIQVAPTGGSQYHTNMQPYLVIYWIICLQGVYPSRS